MNCDNPVFHSNIQKGNTQQNNLMDLLQTEVKENENLEQNYIPENQSIKNYLNSNNNRLRLQNKKIKKVKTVRDVRKEYENYVLNYLYSDLNEQKHKVYSKIQSDSLKSKAAIKLANKILESDIPICKTTWDLITNLNPKHFLNKKQFILYNGNKIKVRGSLGGKRKMLFNYDLNNMNNFKIRKPTLKRKSLIFNSLSVNFKPGPLSKKRLLDFSYQKYNIGNTEIIKLPPVNLEAKALYGATIEPLISNYLHSIREENGVITEQWAEFAVTSLGSVIDSKLVQSTHNPIIFIMKYKNNQNKILMRNNEIQKKCLNIRINYNRNNRNDADEVNSVLEEILNSVVISCSQDNLDFDNDNILQPSDNTKDKSSKRNPELKRLDLNIPYPINNNENNELICCNESYCKLGCVCISVKRGYIIKDHCGLEECIFGCECSYNKLTVKRNTMEENCFASLLKLNPANTLNERLIKQELQFQQTVVATDNNSTEILSKSIKHESNEPVKNEVRYLDKLKIMLLPLKCDDIQSLCMVHKLYRCFCKNRYVNFENNDVELNQSTVQENSFTNKSEKQLSPELNKSNVMYATETNLSSAIINSFNESSKFSNDAVIETLDNIPKNNIIYNETKTNSLDIEPSKNTRSKNKIASTQSTNSIETLYDSDIEINKNTEPKTKIELQPINIFNNKNSYCARTIMYKRKCSSRFYALRNLKINRLESQDINLQNKLNELIGNCKNIKNKDNSSLNLKLIEQDQESVSSESNHFEFSLHKSYKGLNNQSNLKTLLEVHYKHYKDSLKNGTYNDIIKPPIKGKFGLYPWEIILSRYKKRKNYFFVTKQDPFRMFLTVTLDNPFFIKHCINVNDIRISEIHKYPTTIRRLLTEELKAKDYFCILYGLKNCWEILGCVLKLNNDNSKLEENPVLNDNRGLIKNENSCHKELDNDFCFSKKKRSDNLESTTIVQDTCDMSNNKEEFIDNKNKEPTNNTITLTNQEIKNEINNLESNDSKMLINLKRNRPTFDYEQEVVTNKTKVNNAPDFIDNKKNIELTLNNKKDILNIKKECIIETENSDDDILIVENELMSDSDDFNGSQSKLYDSDDSSVTTLSHNVKKNKTIIYFNWFVMELEDNISEIRFLSRGCFIKGKSIQDNIKLARKMKKIVRMSIKSSPPFILPVFGLYVTPCTKKACILIGPYCDNEELGIEIQKDNSATTRALKGTWLSIKKGTNEHILADPISYLDLHNIKSITSVSGHSRVIVNQHDEPQKEQSSVASTNKNNTKLVKPITICKKNKIYLIDLESKIKSLIEKREVGCTNKQELHSSGHSLLKSIKSGVPQVVLSDDEESIVDDRHWRRVWIECYNIENFGYIHAKRNNKNELSFEFPGLKPSPFYTEEVAVSKINEVISRKTFIPKVINPMWRVVKKEVEINNKVPLKAEDFGDNCVLTSQGLIKKGDV